MSASERAEMVYECIQGGAEEYLIKPVTRKEVQNIWTHIIRRLGATAQQPRQPPPTHPALPANPVPAPLGEPAEALVGAWEMCVRWSIALSACTACAAFCCPNP